MECFTVGHSNYEAQHFINLLKAHGINCLVDVRSSPYSKFTPQFNKENLEAELKASRILYVYLGNKLGGRYADSNLLYPSGVVDYNKVMQQDSFCAGIDNVITNIGKGLRIALMCSEKDPLDCHRFLLVSRALSNRGVLVKHILEGGGLISNEELEKKLLRKYKSEFDQFSLFQANLSSHDAIEEAYQRRNQEVGFAVEKAMD